MTTEQQTIKNRLELVNFIQKNSAYRYKNLKNLSIEDLEKIKMTIDERSASNIEQYKIDELETED